jgi:hypothetical protein
MYVKLSIIFIIIVILVSFSSCLYREDLFDLSKDTFNPDIILTVPGGGYIGETEVFIPKTETFTIKNTGDNDLKINELVIVSGDVTQFDIDMSTMKSPLEPGDSTSFDIIFKPTKVKTSNVTVNLFSNDPDQENYEFIVHGIANESTNGVTGPEARIRLGSIQYPTDGTGLLNFGNIEVNRSSLPAKFTIENIGDYELMLYDLYSLNGGGQDFEIDDQSTAKKIAAGGSTTFDVIFTPRSGGLKSAKVNILSDDPLIEIYSISIDGEGSDNPVEDINVTLEDDEQNHLKVSQTETYDFGVVTIGEVERQTFNIMNAGTDELTIIEMVSSNSQFTFDPSFSYLELDPGVDISFDIVFTPVDSVDLTAVISITSSDPDETVYEFTVTGEGTTVPEPKISVMLGGETILPGDVYDFGENLIGIPTAPVEFTISNDGAVDLVIDEITSDDPSQFSVDYSFSIPHTISGSDTFEVIFTPASLNTETANILIANNDPAFNPGGFSFTVTGKGVDPIPVDTVPPSVSAFSPVDEAIDVSPASNFVIIFDEEVVAGTGNIGIYDSAGTLIEAVSVSTGQVTGSGSDTITIDPLNDLAEGIEYYILIEAGAFEDTSANDFAGISDAATWNFKTDSPPYVTNVTSYSNTGVMVYFSEAVEQSTAESTINYSIDNPALTVAIATRDSIDNKKVVLVTDSQGDGTIYTIVISNVEDLTGNSVSTTSMSFTGTGTPDNTAPRIISAGLIDSNTVEVQFSEPVELFSSENDSNYLISDKTGSPVTVTAAMRQTDPSKVRLDISGTFTESLYTLTVAGVTDEVGNPVNPHYDTVYFEGESIIPETLDDGVVIVDPMGEGANDFSMLTKYKGKIYMGPSDTDDMVFSVNPDGSDPELVVFRFTADGINYTTSLDPGPDPFNGAEDGIDNITGGTVSVDGVLTECLFVGPSKSGGHLNYIYYTTDSGSTLTFRPVDLDGTNNLLGNATKGVSSMIVFNGSIYIGFPDTGGDRPYMLKIVNVVEIPIVDTDAFNLNAEDMPRIGKRGDPSNTGINVGIDTFGVFNDRLYVANGGTAARDQDGGIVRSTTDDPEPYPGTGPDWEDNTPVTVTEWDNAGSNRFSKELPGTNKLIPADKAFPAMTVFNGNLFVIRNTTGLSGGPQLWKYDGINPWELVASNGSGITNMGDADNTYVTLLVQNGDRLYIGFDNSADGVQLWRTVEGVTDPVSESDFEQVSASGFDDADNNQRIYNGLSIASGGTDYLWILCGKEAGSLRVYRTNNN